MRLLLAVTILLFSISPIHSQDTSSYPDIDSFSKAIDSLNKDMSRRLQEQQDSFDKHQQKIFMEQNSRNLERFLADMKEREKQEERQMYIRIGLGIAFLIVLIIGLVRRRRSKSTNQ